MKKKKPINNTNPAVYAFMLILLVLLIIALLYVFSLMLTNGNAPSVSDFLQIAG